MGAFRFWNTLLLVSVIHMPLCGIHWALGWRRLRHGESRGASENAVSDFDTWPSCHFGCGWSFADESALIEHEAQCAYKPENIDAAEAKEQSG
jgi:hypothetical protein